MGGGSIDHLLIVEFEWTSGDWCAHVIVCMCVTWLLFERWYCSLQYLRFCLFEMYINVVFVIRCLYSTVSLTLVREQHSIRIIYYYYYYARYPTWQTQDTWFSLISWLWTLYLELSPPPWSQALLNFFIFQNKVKTLPLFTILLPQLKPASSFLTCLCVVIVCTCIHTLFSPHPCF